MGVDSIMDTYESRDISLTFDSELQTVPATLQADVDRAVSSWAVHRRISWKADSYVENPDGTTVASISCYDDVKDGRPHYLYLGFSVKSHSFAIHVRFRRLDSLNDIERILKSIRLTAREKTETSNQALERIAARRYVQLSDD